MSLKQLIIILLPVLLFGLILGACGQSSNVETIYSQNDLFHWQLSPKGDYLVYNNTLINLATKEVKTFNCEIFWWDEQYLGCHTLAKVSVWDSHTRTEIPLQKIKLNEQTNLDLENLLTQAEKLYIHDWLSSGIYALTDTIYVLNVNPQVGPAKNYHLVSIKNAPDILQNYDYIIIPNPYFKDYSENKVFSPDDQYYYLLDDKSIIIYTAQDNKQVSIFSDDEVYFLDVAGWEANSSGVYFSIHPPMFNFIISKPHQIKKLKVPQP